MSKYEKSPEKLRQDRLAILFMTESTLEQRYIEFETDPDFFLRKEIRALEQRRDTLLKNIAEGE